jgi:uncharacterized protein (DUF2141 family)
MLCGSKHGKARLQSKLLVCFFLLVVAVYTGDSNAQSSSDSHGNEVYRIAGEILLKEIRKGGSLYVMLVTEESFKSPLRGFKKMVLKIGDEEIKEERVSFEFAEIPPGTYGIRCFLDEDGNGKLNKGAFGPSEPWGMSWQGEQPLGWPKFKYIAFDVNKDIMDIRVVVE